jgi:hypothetical protein
MTNDAPAGRIAAVAWSLLVLLLVTNVPLFLCMPLTDDAAMYDLQTLNWLHGGTLYRDIVEPNLPGVIWLHAAVRCTLGTSSMTLRAVDLLLFTAFVVLSRNWLASSGATRAIQAWSVFVLFLCYFSLSEWCHCQRDVWLLVPGLAGLTLRRQQIHRLRAVPTQSTQARSASEGTSCQPRLRVGLVSAPTTSGMTQAARWAFLEGLCWGAGVWLKPMIILPAACCWILSVLYVHSWRRSLVDLFGLVSGGLLIGGLGVAWLVWSGAWPYFLATLLEWNPRYMAAAREQWTFARYAAMQVRFFPWQLLHLAAIPIALVTIGRQIGKWWKSRNVEKSTEHQSKSGKVEKSKGQTAESSDSVPPGFFSSSTFRLFDFLTFSLFYLAWLVQSYWLQHLFDYVHAPALLLAIVVVAASFARRAAEQSAPSVDASLRDAPPRRHGVTGLLSPPVRRRIGRFARRLAVAWFAVLVLLTTPVVRPHRLACWRTCVREGSTSEVRDGLKCFSVPSWRDLDRVAEYLRAQGLSDRELTCYHNGLVHLYGILGLRSSTRYVYLEQVVAYFPERHAVFLQALSDSRQRYVVTDLFASGLSPSGIARLCAEGPLARPPRFPSRLRDVYPWSQPAVFRAGPYLVHRVERPLGRLEVPRKPP